VQQAGAVQDGELLGRTRQRFEVALERGPAVDQLVQALALDELAQHEGAPIRRHAEADHARHTEALEAGERHGLAHERGHFAIARAGIEELERVLPAAMAIADGPDLAAPALAQARKWLVACGELAHSP